MWLGQNLVVAGDDVQHIEQLSLVFVHALDLHVEQALGVDHHAGFAGNALGQTAFVVGFGQAEGVVELGFIGQLAQLGQLAQVPPPGGADAAVDQR